MVEVAAFCYDCQLCENSAEACWGFSDLTITTVTPQHGNPQNIKTLPSIDFQNCDEVTYEKKDDIHGVSYTDENGLAGWTPVVGRKKKKHCQCFCANFLQKLAFDMQITVTLAVSLVALTRILKIWFPTMQLLHSLLMKTCSLISALKQ